MEEWREIPFSPFYEVSNMGRVRKVKHIVKNMKNLGKIINQSKNQNGNYVQVALWVDGKRRNFRVNRLVCMIFHGDPPTPKHHAAHLNGKSLDNRAENLSWKTPKENEKDKIAHGTARIGDKHWSKSMPEKRARGVDHGKTKIDEDQVRAIRKDPRNNSQVGKEYGLDKTTILNIRKRKTWGHVE